MQHWTKGYWKARQLQVGPLRCLALEDVPYRLVSSSTNIRSALGLRHSSRCDFTVRWSATRCKHKSLLPHVEMWSGSRLVRAAACNHALQRILLHAVSGPESGKPKRITRNADGKLTCLVSLGGSWHEKLTLLVTHVSLLTSGPCRHVVSRRTPSPRSRWRSSRRS